MAAADDRYARICGLWVAPERRGTFVSRWGVRDIYAGGEIDGPPAVVRATRRVRGVGDRALWKQIMNRLGVFGCGRFCGCGT